MEVLDLIKSTNKIMFCMYTSIIMALLLGVYGQDISYFIDANIFSLSPVYYLTDITMISIILFLMPYMIITKLNKKLETEGKQLDLFFVINSLVGIITSVWSLFVLIMWWS